MAEVNSSDTAWASAASAAAPDDAPARLAVSYLVAPEAAQYIAVMTVLEASLTDLTPGQVSHALSDARLPLEVKTVEDRLDKLRVWGAVTARTDTSDAKRFSDLLARNWRYTATPVGREVQRFYSQRLAGTQLAREIPLASLQRAIGAIQTLQRLLREVPVGSDVSDLPATTVAELSETVATLFVSQDDLDAALVGAEETLGGLADRFDLDTDRTGVLKDLLVEYATRVASELSRGGARAHAGLLSLRGHTDLLAAAAVHTSAASELIGRGALTASRGGAVADYQGLLAWLDPASGRAARLGLALVRAIPGMQANLRRLHTSSGTATARSRALALAWACTDPIHGRDVLAAALGDHAWRKLQDTSDDDHVRMPSWHSGPTVDVGDILRAIGRTGSRGKPAASRDDTAARAESAAARLAREQARAVAVAQILDAAPGTVLSPDAAKVALDALTYTARTAASGRVRRAQATRLGVACTLVYTPGSAGAVSSPYWTVICVDRTPVFHSLGTVADVSALLAAAAGPDPDARARLEVVA